MPDYSLKIPRLAESLLLRKIPSEVRSIIERQSERGFKKTASSCFCRHWGIKRGSTVIEKNVFIIFGRFFLRFAKSSTVDLRAKNKIVAYYFSLPSFLLSLSLSRSTLKSDKQMCQKRINSGNLIFQPTMFLHNRWTQRGRPRPLVIILFEKPLNVQFQNTGWVRANRSTDLGTSARELAVKTVYTAQVRTLKTKY